MPPSTGTPRGGKKRNPHVGAHPESAQWRDSREGLCPYSRILRQGPSEENARKAMVLMGASKADQDEETATVEGGALKLTSYSKHKIGLQLILCHETKDFNNTR